VNSGRITWPYGRTDLEAMAFHFARSSDTEITMALLGEVVDDDLR